MPEGTCCEDGCAKPVASRERCESHYRARLRKGDRVYRRKGQAASVRGPYEGCWEWQGSLNKTGYGITQIDNRKVLVHRAVYAAIYDDFDPLLFVLHHCDNPPCFRPDHLFLGTQADNMQDMSAKGRGSRRWLKVTDAQVEEIRRRWLAGESSQEIAARFRLNRDYVGAIIRGHDRGGPNLRAEQYRKRSERDSAIMAGYLAGISQADLARQFGLKPNHVCAILRRDLHPRTPAA
jgi:hypothetical protein